MLQARLFWRAPYFGARAELPYEKVVGSHAGLMRFYKETCRLKSKQKLCTFSGQVHLGDRKKDLSADNVFVRKYIRILHSTPRCILQDFEADNSAERYGAEVQILADMRIDY